MNYIHSLRDKTDHLQAEVEQLTKGLASIRDYLLSDKFHENTTVQVNDILTRLEEVRSDHVDLHFEPWGFSCNVDPVSQHHRAGRGCIEANHRLSGTSV
jgi:hypothetical protein